MLTNAPRIFISAFVPASSVASPVDRRPEICPPGAEPADDIADDAIMTAAVGPRLVTGEPIVVTTGGANMDRPILSNVPLPRPKPAPPADALGIATAPAPSTEVPLPRPRPAV